MSILILNISAVSDPITEYSNKKSMRKNYRKNPPITKEELTSLYNELKSIAKIGIKIGVNTVTIFNWMKYYEIPRIKNNKNPYFKGKKIPKESVLKMRKSLKKYYETHNNHRKGVKASLETRQKQSIAHKGKIPPIPEGKYNVIYADPNPVLNFNIYKYSNC